MSSHQLNSKNNGPGLFLRLYFSTETVPQHLFLANIFFKF